MENSPQGKTRDIVAGQLGTSSNTLAREQLRETPEVSDRQIAKGLGVDNSTVSRHRKQLEQSGELLHCNSSLGADGKARPRERRPKLRRDEPERPTGKPEQLRIIDKPALPIDSVHEDEPSDADKDAFQSHELVRQGSPTREPVKPTCETERGMAVLYPRRYANESMLCDLLITEAPDDAGWLYTALNGVRHTGFAYVFVSPRPDVLTNYLIADVPLNVELSQVLVWSFDYVLGNADRGRYKPSWKAILFYRGTDAGSLDFPRIEERSSVHVMNADNDGLGKPGYELRMPMGLAQRFIRQSTKEGELVFDPFANNGTFLEAAAITGRDAIGYESDELKVEEMRRRGIEIN